MIAKVSKGITFPGLAHYLVKDGRGQVLEMQHLSSDTPLSAGSEMQLAALMSRRTQEPVLHISIRTAPGDRRLTDDEMRQDARRVLTSLGLERNQAMVVRHGGDHFHIMVNRVGADGKTVSDSNSYARIERTLREIECERGLTVVQGRHAPDANGQRMTGSRTSSDPRQHKAPESVRQTLLTARSWPELDAGLALDGWRMERTQRPGKKPGALLIGPDGQRIAAGRIDRDATLSKISSRIDGVAKSPVSDQPKPKMRIARLNGGVTMPGRSGGMMKLAQGGKRKSPLGTRKSMKAAGAESMKLLGQVVGGAPLLGAAAGRRRKPSRRPGSGGLSL